MFPRGRINADGQKPRGKICKLCDRKFLVRQVTLENAVSSQKSKQLVRTLDQDLENAKKENVIQVNSRDQDRYRYQNLLKVLQGEIEDMQE